MLSGREFEMLRNHASSGIGDVAKKCCSFGIVRDSRSRISSEVLKNGLREKLMMVTSSCPNLITVSDIWALWPHKTVVIDYEKVDDQEKGILYFISQSYRKFTFQEKACFLDGLFGGAIALHGVGLIHRDIKPSNLLLSFDGDKCTPVLGDVEFVTHPGPNLGVVYSEGYTAPELLEILYENTMLIEDPNISPEEKASLYKRYPTNEKIDIYGMAMTIKDVVYSLANVHNKHSSQCVKVQNVLNIASAHSPENRYDSMMDFRDAFIRASIEDGLIS